MVAFISLGVWLTFAIGRINMAQAGFCLIGGYVSAILVSRVGWSFWLSLPLAGCVSAVVGAVIGWPVLRLKGVYFAMLTLCITEACRLAALSFPALTQGAQGIVDLPLPGGLSLFGLTLIPPFEKGARLPFYFLSGAVLNARARIPVARRHEPRRRRISLSPSERPARCEPRRQRRQVPAHRFRHRLLLWRRWRRLFQRHAAKRLSHHLPGHRFGLFYGRPLRRRT